MVLAHDTTQGLRTHDVKISQDVTFDTMLLSPETMQGLHSGGFHRPSPVQLHGIPLGKCGFDILLEAKSGTGKTAVFSVIALEKLNLSKGLQVVILAPTREIAAQICDVMKVIGSGYTGLCVEVVMGGLPVQEDIAKFTSKKKVHILVGSPGRLRHLIHDGYIDTSSVRLLVLDEADKLVEKSFQADINYIFSVLPKQKQVILSSATYTEETKTYICQYVQNSQHVCPDSTSVLLGIEQKFTVVSFSSNVVIQTKQKYKELLKILSQKQFKQCLIFCNYQARVAKLHNMLTRDEWPSEQLYGQQDQIDRLDALKTLQEYKCRILIATDLAARGIDASNVDLVINFEPPYEWQTYLHRIGRAGRYGSYGVAVTILSEGAEKFKFMKILKPMKGSLKMSNLWDDRNFFSDEFTEATPHVQHENGNNANISIESSTATQSPDLWKEITTTSDEVKEIQSFVNESLSTNIESFSDLLQSFENDAVNNESQDILYANIKVDETSAKLSLSYLQSKIKTTYKELNLNSSLKTDNLIKDQPITHGYNIEQVTASHSGNDHSYSNIAIEKCTVKECKAENVTQSQKTNVSIPKETENNIDANVANDYESDEAISAINKDMALLGLPTAFASKRDSDRNKNKAEIQKLQHCKKVYNEQNNNFTISFGQNNVNQICIVDLESSKIKKQLNEMKDSQKYVEDVSTSHKSECVENRSAKANTTGVARQRKYKKCDHTRRGRVHTRKSASIDYESESSSSIYEDSSIQSRVNLNYINWFKQLKMRTQQLEMAFYIEEMSKM